eukprot:gene32269-41821_t
MDELPGDANTLIQKSSNLILSTSVEKALIIAQQLAVLTRPSKGRSHPAEAASSTPLWCPADLLAAVAAAAVASRRLSVLGAAANAANAANNSANAGGGLSTAAPSQTSSSNSRNPPSACTQFKNELSILIKQINYTTPHYIRCIKPIDSLAWQSSSDTVVSRMQLVSQASDVLQRYCLFRANRSKYLRSKKAVVVLQKYARGMVTRKKTAALVKNRPSKKAAATQPDQKPDDGGAPAATTEKKPALDDTRGSNYLASKVVEYRKQDDQLLKEINTLISSKKSSDEMSIINFDINNAKKMLKEWSSFSVKSKEVEYANASAAIKSDNNKTNLFFMYEQEITKLNRQIHYANKVIEFCRVLNQYYVKYITLFVQEYGFADENQYIIALCLLIEQQKPLLEAEKKGIEFSVNSFNILLLGEILMYPIRFIKVAFYQASTNFTQLNLGDVLGDPNLILGIHNDSLFSNGVFNNSRESSDANVLFLLPQLNSDVDPEVRAVLTRSRAVPEEIISSWLRELYLQNKRYESLISSGFTVDDLVRLQLPIKLPPGTVLEIYRNEFIKNVDFGRFNNEVDNAVCGNIGDNLSFL